MAASPAAATTTTTPTSRSSPAPGRNPPMLIDGLQCGHFTPEVFAALRRGGIGAVTVTCGFWEDPMESFDALGRWRDLIAENAATCAVARTPAEIEAVAASGRTAIILGYQNTDL